MFRNIDCNRQQEDTGKKVNKYYLSPEYWAANTHKVRACTKRRPVVVLIPEMYYGSPAPCTYIRLFTPLMSPEFCAGFEIRVASLKSAMSISADAIIVNRVPCEHVSELSGFVSHLRKTGAKLIYDIDDQLLDLADGHPEAKVYTNRQAVVRELLSAADLVWVSTLPLAEAFGSINNKITVFENYLELDCFDKKDVSHSLSNRVGEFFNILYMGSTTHAADLSLVIDAMCRLHSEGVKFELFLIGISENAPQYSWIKVIQPPVTSGNNNYPEFMRWLRSLNKFDLGIAPLEANNFNRCKSAIKYWDYTSLGIPTLASDVTAYNDIIIDEDNGFLAKNSTDDWYIKLKSAVSNKALLIDVALKAKAALRKLYVQIDGAERRRESVIRCLSNEVPLQGAERNGG